jgi:hypothetical protein
MSPFASPIRFPGADFSTLVAINIRFLDFRPVPGFSDTDAIDSKQSAFSTGQSLTPPT